MPAAADHDQAGPERAGGEADRSSGLLYFTPPQLREGSRNADFSVLPAGFARDVESAAGRRLASAIPRNARSSAKAIAGRLERLRELDELGDLPLTEYTARRDALRAEDGAVRAPRNARDRQGQSEQLGTLVGWWDQMTIEEQKRVVAHVFEEVHPGRAGRYQVPATRGLAFVHASRRTDARRWGS